MLHPFQCLLYCPPTAVRKRSILLAAAGSRIFSFDIQNGTFISVWPSTSGIVQEHSAVAPSTDHDPGRPEKRRKLAIPQHTSSSDSAEIVVENGNNVDVHADNSQVSTSNVIKLERTADSEFIVAVTGEDKCIRVFKLHEDGKLTQLSKRHGGEKVFNDMKIANHVQSNAEEALRNSFDSR